ncbi:MULTISPECIES: arylformamidase [unclassified Sphingobium]|uniref:arylformamidase n=1 Tax=unclassified Sphingobium TaxID=2611147 RepID=UPI00077001D8|nr:MULTISPECIES: arylformamidase [Sphingomonadaceae]AMK25439.1 putative cyclase [Sphingobium sp. TKS]NML90905.1 arylformamidase [Sphingobium sp. TB-6]
MKIWDISQTLRPGMPMWPGEPALAVRRNAVISAQCPVNVGEIDMPLHAGTHADSPYHYDPQGVASAQCGIDAYIGRCVVIDVRHARGRVEAADVDWTTLTGSQRVLFRTYDRFPADRWDSDFTAVAAEVIARLRENGVRLVGTDAASLDPEQSKTMDAHREIQIGDMRILEGLVLDDVPAGEYELIALPLKIAEADASPVRAILREISR